MTRHNGKLAIIAALAAFVILLPGCGSTRTAWDIMNNTHDEVDCKFKRTKTDYEGSCTFKGSLPVREEGAGVPVSPMMAGF